MVDMESFEKMRVDALNYMRTIKESIFKEWLSYINCKYIVGYNFNSLKRCITIYAERPGMLIGYNGENIEILRQILLGTPFKSFEIKFEEVEGFYSICGGY